MDKKCYGQPCQVPFVAQLVESNIYWSFAEGVFVFVFPKVPQQPTKCCKCLIINIKAYLFFDQQFTTSCYSEWNNVLQGLMLLENHINTYKYKYVQYPYIVT